MKFQFVIILLWTIATVNAMTISEAKAAIKIIATPCISKMSITPDELDDLFENVTTDKSKCLRNCIMRQYKIIDEDGSLLKQGVINAIKKASDGSDENADAASETADICRLIKESDPCESAHKYSSCIIDQLGSRGLTLPIF